MSRRLRSQTATSRSPTGPTMDNDRTAWIFVALMVLTFAFFAAGVLALAFWSFA